MKALLSRISGNCSYDRRILDDSIDDLLPSFAEISIDGAHAIGRASTGRQRAKTILDLDLTSHRSTF